MRAALTYAVIGAVALNQHGYQRFTSDIDILLSPAGLELFRAELVGRGYRPAFEGARKKFRATSENVPIEIITAGEYPGDGKPKAIVFPDPALVAVEIGGVKTVNLEKLVELKLASGLSGMDRLRDLADVQDLIRILGLSAEFAERIDDSVRAAYRDLWDGVQRAREQKRGAGFRGLKRRNLLHRINLELIMTYVLELKPEVARKLEARAARKGVKPEEIVEELLTEAAPETEHGIISDEQFQASKQKIFTKYARAFEVLAEGAK